MNVFSRIYTNNEWNGIETRSGPGSHREPTRRVADALLRLVRDMDIRSVLNVGCGEDWWMPDLPGYIGLDITPEALEVAKQNHPERTYVLWDGGTLPRADLVICRDVIQHLSLDGGLGLLVAIAKSGSTWAVISTYVMGENVDITPGDAYSPNLYDEPFRFAPAMALIHDGYEYHDGDRLRDPAKMLGLWRL